MFTVESKSQLAKLLASENLIVEHKNIPTAYFNLKTRTLACPVWKNMSGDLYDLLMGHEVGHALYTPEQGWHDAVCSEGKNFKSFLNVIEDSRIEKKIKRKYPGIKRSFVNAYKDLLDRDFFGIKDRNLETMPFIDKVNLFTKTDGFINFDFSDNEQSMIDRVLSCETWDDVYAVAKEIFEYSKDEQKSILEEHFTSPSFDFSDDEDDGGFSMDYDDEDSSIEDEESVDGDEEETSSSADSSDEDEDGDGETEESFGTGFDRDYSDEEFEPSCETDEHYRSNEVKLLDESCREYVYLNIPKPVYEKIVTPYTIVHSHLTKKFDDQYGAEKLNNVYKDFRNKNEKYVSLLAKEFEMRKSARAYMKNKVADTGDIDINKIFKYQIDDNIFKKITIQQKGKSHGLVLLLDHSGSMCNNIGASIEQILILSMFCKKVNIPFVVYSFVDYYLVRKMDFPGDDFKQNCFEIAPNCLSADRVYLREYLNSSMSLSEYNRCIRNMTMMAKLYNNRTWYKIPESESFGGTPLIESMIALKGIVKSFKKNNNLDIVNTVIVHDGDADTINQYKDSEGHYKRFSPERHNVYLNDKSENIQIKLESDQHPFYDYDYALKNAIFDWYKKVTGSKIFGFYIAGQGTAAKKNVAYKYRTKDNKCMIESSSHRGVFYKSEFDALYKTFREQKFVESKNPGYDAFYLIPGGKDLSVENDELVITGNVTKGKLKSAFAKMAKKKQSNRILVNRFITGIA